MRGMRDTSGKGRGREGRVRRGEAGEVRSGRKSKKRDQGEIGEVRGRNRRKGECQYIKKGVNEWISKERKSWRGGGRIQRKKKENVMKKMKTECREDDE